MLIMVIEARNDSHDELLIVVGIVLDMYVLVLVACHLGFSTLYLRNWLLYRIKHGGAQ